MGWHRFAIPPQENCNTARLPLRTDSSAIELIHLQSNSTILKGISKKLKYRSWGPRIALLGIGATLMAAVAASAVAHDSDESGSRTPIKHVVVIFPENESFDHYFATYPHAANKHGEPKFQAREDTPAVNNLLSAGLLAKNPNLRQPFRYDRSEAYTCSLDHNYTDEQKAVNGGLNDMFVQATSRVGLGCRADGSSVM